ncbi:MAG TPA: hypothetical protein VHX65_15555 [Pirellulales bacterium]|nr:hypothetical protein [Pirellulales bacterium]
MFSIAAIGVGVIGLALFAIPYAGVALGVAGLALGIYSVAQSASRRDASMGLALAGAAISVAAMGVGGFFTFRAAPQKMIAKAAPSAAVPPGPSTDGGDSSEAGSGDARHFAVAAVKAAVAGAVADARNPASFAAAAIRGAARDPAKRADRLASTADGHSNPIAAGNARVAGPVTLRLQDPANPDKIVAADAAPGALPAGDNGSSPSATPGGEDSSQAKAAVKAPIHWAAVDQNEAQGNDDIKVTVTKAVTGPLFYRLGGNALLDGKETTFPVLHISVKVENHQTAGVIDYKGWITLPDADATLTDDQGAEIKRFDLSKYTPPGESPSVIDSHPAAKIDISESNEDVIVFQLPPEGTQYVRLKLSGKPVGLPDDLYFQIPRSMIKPGETGNPLLPLGPP